MLDKIESAEAVGLGWLSLGGLGVHGAWDIQDTDDGNIVSFPLKFRRGNLEVGHEFELIKRWDCLNRKALVVVHSMFVLIMIKMSFIKDLYHVMILIDYGEDLLDLLLSYHFRL